MGESAGVQGVRGVFGVAGSNFSFLQPARRNTKHQSDGFKLGSSLLRSPEAHNMRPVFASPFDDRVGNTDQDTRLRRSRIDEDRVVSIMDCEEGTEVSGKRDLRCQM